MNMKLVAITFLAIIVILMGFFLLPDDNNIKNSDTAPFPILTEKNEGNYSDSAKITLVANNNLEFQVDNFIDNNETIVDIANEDHYIMAGDPGTCMPNGHCPKGFDSDNFSVSYSMKESFFTLVVLREPISVSRQEAEQFLKNRLGLNEEEMCNLKYSFSAPYWVNESYAGRELGFSFCSGSVSLE